MEAAQPIGAQRVSGSKVNADRNAVLASSPGLRQLPWELHKSMRVNRNAVASASGDVQFNDATAMRLGIAR
jgi:hypothetical protein